MIDIGKMLIIFGVITIVIGGILMLSGKVPWIGRLPRGYTCPEKELYLLFSSGYKYSSKPPLNLNLLADKEKVKYK